MGKTAWKRGLLALMLSCAGLWSVCVQAEEGATQSEGGSVEVERLRKIILEEQQVIADCMKRIDKLEAAKTTNEKNGLSNIKISGDFRYRYEYIDQDQKTLYVSGNNPLKPFREINNRDRHRIRLRVGTEWMPTPDWTVGMQLATTMGGDPISTNQTLTGGFSKKDLWIDKAYFDYHPAQVSGLKVVGGKMDNPFTSPSKTELIWDGDLTPEGLMVRYSTNPNPKEIKPWEVYGTVGWFQLEERSFDIDSDLLGLQIGGRYNFDEEGLWNLKGSVAYYDFNNVENYPFLFDATDNFGNSLGLAVLGGQGLYAEDYNLVNGYAEFEFPIGRFPATVFGDVVVNTAANDDYFTRGDENLGWMVGMTLGKCAVPGSFALRYNYRDVERDAIVGAFADSDFGGGGTDARGHEIGVEYQLFKNVKAELSYFMNTLNGSNYIRLLPTWGRRENIPGDYRRLQLDLNVKF